MNEERVYLKLASDSSSDNDEEKHFKSTKAVANKSRKNSSVSNNRVRGCFAKVKRCSLGVILFALSLVANIILVILIVAPKECCKDQNYHQCDSSSEFKQETTSHPAGAGFEYTSPSGNVPVCGASHPNLEKYRESALPGENIFEDLSSVEISSVYGYLSKQPELQIKPHQVIEGSHVYSIELHVPDKMKAIQYISGQGSKPAREARVVIERSDLSVPVVEEYIVGPLPIPNYHLPNTRGKKHVVPYRFHPQYGINAAYIALFMAMSPELDGIIRESFGATFVNCSQNCLQLQPQKTSSAYSSTTLVLLSAYYATDFTTINPVDLTFIMKETSKGSQTFVTDSMFYGGRVFRSVPEFIRAYQTNSLRKIRMTYPRPGFNQTSIAGTMNIRGRRFPAFYQEGPKQFQPEGNRYIVVGQHVQYLEWSFCFRMSTASGPQLWDVRWAGQRIVYEISLQEMVVLYAGADPKTFFSHLSDSAFGLGEKASGLMPGVDCPEHATFVSQTVFKKYLNGPLRLPNAFCLFEHNMGLPLRRHRSRDRENGNNYGGLVDRVLILRTVIVEYNYDYIIDVVFHQNGAIEIKTHASGYILSHVNNDGEVPFGFRVHSNIVGSIHHHLINFKIDLDILGQNNRYETLDFVVDERPWPWYRGGSEPFQQISFRHNLKRTEQEAVVRYNFSTPKYHIVYNEGKKNDFGNHRAYRIDTRGFSKQILPDDSPVLRSRKWTKYQMLTTKRKDQEESSSSIFSMFDGEDPHVDIDRYLMDDESVVDEDLVFWITVGFHHLPHTEDIPNTPTIGAEATISLLPYNYFEECPSVGSRDALRVAFEESGLVVQDYGASNSSNCSPEKFGYSDLVSQISSLFP